MSHERSPNACELILQLHQHDQAPTMKQMGGLWKRRVDERWTFWVNGQMKPLPIPGSTGTLLPPGEVWVEYNGWPAGMFSLITGEGTIAAGTGANYDTFCEALEAAIQSDARPGKETGATVDNNEKEGKP